MNRDPVLAAATLPTGTNGYRVPLTFRVEGGLHYINGNSAPHFSLTYTSHRKGFPNQCYSGGAGHDEILKRFPRFADLAALHLSDIDGVPMCAEANGWYWLAGSLGGLGESYHGGNGSSAKSEAECLTVFAQYVRVTEAEAAAIRSAVIQAYGDHDEQEGGMEERRQAARAEWTRTMDAMRPRWKAEAEAAIANHNLKVYGDPWEVNA